MNLSSPQIALSAPSALFLFFFAFTGPVGAEAVIGITGDMIPATPHIVSGQAAAVEPPHASVGGKTFIRIIGDKQTTAPKPVRKQVVRPEPGQSASAVDEGRNAAETIEQERLARVQAEQENEAALQTALARLEAGRDQESLKAAEQHAAQLIAEEVRLAAAKAALIENSLQKAETPVQLKKITPSKQADRRHKGVKKRHRKCLKYSSH
ncbi:MAG: hypothetical protein ACYDHC_01825 [Desulfuromonadaceae bacterium]